MYCRQSRQFPMRGRSVGHTDAFRHGSSLGTRLQEWFNRFRHGVPGWFRVLFAHLPHVLLRVLISDRFHC